MECPSCLLRYNSTTRSPLILSCGHSLCSSCISALVSCPVCAEHILKNPKPNYSLLQMIDKDSKPIDKFIKVCFVGSSAVGKTSLIKQFMGQDFNEEVATTIGYDFTFRDRQLGGYCVRFQLWDSAGQQRYRAISPIHYKNSHVVIIVYNVSSSADDNRVAEWIHQADKHAPAESIKILVGNKLDLIEGKMCRPLDDEAWDLVKEKKIECYETSCKSGAGIDQFWQVLEYFFFHRKQFDKQGENPEKTMGSNLLVKSKQRKQQLDREKSKMNTKLLKKANKYETKKQQCC